jgi:hypothetical protein
MKKDNNRILWIGVTAVLLGGLSYFLWKKFRKPSEEEKNQKDCEDSGGIWNAETKSCDLPQTLENLQTASNPIKTGKKNIDTLISGLGTKGKLSKTKDGKYFVEVIEPIVAIGKDNKLQFWENDMFWFGTKKGKLISKGIYADGGRKMSITEGKNKGKNAVTKSMYDTVKIIIG